MLKKSKKLMAIILALVVTCSAMYTSFAASAEKVDGGTLYGDADGDSKILMSDVVIVQRSIASLTALSESQKLAADVTGDGNVKMDDVTDIQRYIASIITKFDADKDTNTDTNTDTDTTSTDTASETDSKYIASSADVGFELFRRAVTGEENVMISPASLALALSLTANGADGDTLKEMAQVLCKEDNVEAYNVFLKEYQKIIQGNSENAKLAIANSIWMATDAQISLKDAFKKIAEEYYGASLFEKDFKAPETVNEINGWVKENTFDMIDKLLDGIGEDTVMYLINAIAFEAQWMNIYNTTSDADFTNSDGTKSVAAMLNGSERIYIEDSDCTGFVKPYEGNYDFVAILPNEGVNTTDFIKNLTGEKYMNLIKNASENYIVNTEMPKFKFEFGCKYKDILRDMGMNNLFDGSNADLTRLASSAQRLSVSQVIHKTFIDLNEKGTSAAAVTAISADSSYFPDAQYKTVTLNRPFIFVIKDRTTNLPIFTGTLLSLNQN